MLVSGETRKLPMSVVSYAGSATFAPGLNDRYGRERRTAA